MISIWQTDMAERAFLWLSGVTPAQQSAFTEILTSGKSDLIKKALKKHKGKRKFAAQELGISERTLYRKIKELSL